MKIGKTETKNEKLEPKIAKVGLVFAENRLVFAEKKPVFAYFESRTQKKGKGALISAPFPFDTCNIFIKSEKSGSFLPKKDPFSPSIANQRHPLWTFGPGSEKYLEIFAIFPVFMAGTCTIFRPRCLHRLPELVINAKRGEDLLFQVLSP